MSSENKKLAAFINESIQSKYKDRFGEEFCNKILVMKLEHILYVLMFHSPDNFKTLQEQITSGAI